MHIYFIYQRAWILIIFYYGRVHTEYQAQLNNIRESVILQGLAFKHTAGVTIEAAEGGQIIARRIVYLLRKIKQNPSKDVLEDLLESLQEKIKSQLKCVQDVKSGFKSIRAGLLKVRSPACAGI